MSYMNDNFLLTNETARKLYFDYAKDMPIFDYHCHLPERELLENAPCSDLAALWLGGDHYKWRLMRNYGVEEEIVTGEKAPAERFHAFCKALGTAFGNPLYHWSQAELSFFFGCDLEINEKNADAILEHCNTYMRENGIADVSELYSKFVGEMTSYVLELGRTPIVWEGFPKKGHEHIPRETIVVAWESYYHMVYDLLEEGFRVINASWSPLYIVPSFTTRWSPFDILKWNVHRWQHWWPKSEAYLNPITVPDTDRVLGAALCCWEQSFEQEINAVMENIAAVAERTWNVQRRVSDEEYNELYQSQRKTLARIIQDR